jgi:hypothetical protein
VTASFCVSAAAESITFRIGGQTLPLHVLSQQEQSSVALLQIDSSTPLATYLDQSRVRDPQIGEPVYLALSLADQSVQLRTCLVASSSIGENDFEHDCSTGLGSSGAIIIAVADDALLGIHHSKGPSGGGQASKISVALKNLSAYLISSGPVSGPSGE